MTAFFGTALRDRFASEVIAIGLNQVRADLLIHTFVPDGVNLVLSRSFERQEKREAVAHDDDDDDDERS